MTALLSRTGVLLGLLLLGSTSMLEAQVAPDVVPGTRVRVSSATTGKAVGLLQAGGPDTLAVIVPPGHLRSWHLEEVRRVEISQGPTPRVRSTLKGAGMGMVSGAVGGAVGMVVPHLILGNPCTSPQDDFFCFNTAEWALLGVILGAPMGAVVGAGVGLLFPQERWRAVPVERVRLTTSAGPADTRGVALSLTVQ